MIISVDVGYSHTKAATDGRRAIFPSVWGEVQQSHMTGYGLENGAGYIQVETEDGAWFIGDAALEQSSMQSRRQDRGWIKTPEYRALILAAMSELTTGSGIAVRMVTGLPVSYMSDRDEVKTQFKGTHSIRCEGRRAQRFDITDIEVLPQGLAAILSEALDDNGNIPPGPLSEGLVGLLDIGGHTINVATFKELREIVPKTTSIDGGLWTPMAEIGKQINAAFPGQELRGHDVVSAVVSGTIRHYGEERDVSGIAQDILGPFARRIVDDASQVWGSAAQLDVLLISGGGAEVVGPALQAEYPHARVVSDPQWANTVGYLKFGHRLWQ